MDDVLGESSWSPRGQAAAYSMHVHVSLLSPQQLRYHQRVGRRNHRQMQAMVASSLTHQTATPALPPTPRAIQSCCNNTRRFWAVLSPPCCLAAAHGLLPGTANTQRLVARQSVLWPQHFTFLSAVSADNSVTCSHVMTDRSKLAGGPLYTVLGDQTGRLYFFTPQGYLLHEYDTGNTPDMAVQYWQYVLAAVWPPALTAVVHTDSSRKRQQISSSRNGSA
jgi:hypothetical protein